MHPGYLNGVKENVINAMENPTHTLPIVCFTDTVVTMYLVQLQYTCINTGIKNNCNKIAKKWLQACFRKIVYF